MHVRTLDVATAESRPAAYLFGGFRLDLGRRLLFRQSQAVRVPDHVFQILLILIEAKGDIVHREVLASRVWPDTAVGDGNIAQHVYLLRQILGEHLRDRSIVTTVNGKGYRLTIPVSVEWHDSDNKGPALEAIDSGETESFRDYCHGSYLLERRNAPALKRAIEIFESGLESDPDHVPSLVGLARAYALLGEYWYLPPATAFAKAKAAIRRALGIAPSSANAHAVLSGLMMFSDWDWRGAHSELETAVSLNPNASIVRNNTTYYYICTGEHDRALSEARHATLAEPSSLSRQLLLGLVRIHAGEYRDGISCMSRLIEIDRDFYVARRYRAQAFLLGGQPEEALADLLLLPQERSEETCFRLPLLARAYAECGEVERAGQVYANLQGMENREYVASWNLAIVATGLGLFEEALTHLERAFECREPALLFLKSLPWFVRLGDHPRFRRMLAAIGP